MLTCLRANNLAIIDAIDVPFERGLNVITGETGAGKSILVQALQLVFGARASGDVIRSGTRQAEVEALFAVTNAADFSERFAALGLDPPQGELVIRRVISADGRSRAYLNGRLVTTQQLRDATFGLADICSQHEYHTLFEPINHLLYLDRYAGLDEPRRAMLVAYQDLIEARRALRLASERTTDRAMREDILRFQLREIDDVEPSIDELEELRAQRERLRHVDRLFTIASAAENELYAGDGAVSETLSRLANRLDEAVQLDPSLKEAMQLVATAEAHVQEAASIMGRYARALSSDPDELARVQDRVEKLERLTRKYGGELGAVLAYRIEARAELAALENSDERVRDAETAVSVAVHKAQCCAEQLRQGRTAAAAKLAQAITAELAALSMGDAEVRVELAPVAPERDGVELEGHALTATGIDRAEFLIAPNRGEEPRPLRRIASGGELSRAMLAIRRVLTQVSPAGIYVFDEVDAGVGGGVAEAIGRKLYELAQDHQVICITHLPQIAVYGGAHLHVHKQASAGRTYTAVDRLDEGARVEEVARMLGGVRVTDAARRAAVQLLDDARAAQKNARLASDVRHLAREQTNAAGGRRSKAARVNR